MRGVAGVEEGAGMNDNYGWIAFTALGMFVIGLLFGSMNEREFITKHPSVICDQRKATP